MKQQRAATAESSPTVTALKIIFLPLYIQLTNRVNNIQLAAELIRVFDKIQRFQLSGHAADVAVGAGCGVG
ncbi:hypothetical protein QYZ88_009115 [Lachnospiraceae bacterium C1.1]|nr:hypothetical protein [Lachnospiraceae bacterium C1.1]